MPAREPGDAPGAKPKKPLKMRVILDDAWELVRARKGRLAFGLFLMLINRLSGLVLPGTTKFLLDEVIGKHNQAMLKYLVLAAGGATLLQAITSFTLSQILGKAAQRSITDMRRVVQQHVSRLPVGYFDRTKAGALLSRVMNDAEGLRNLVGTGLVDVIGGMVTATLTGLVSGTSNYVMIVNGGGGIIGRNISFATSCSLPGGVCMPPDMAMAAPNDGGCKCALGGRGAAGGLGSIFFALVALALATRAASRRWR